MKRQLRVLVILTAALAMASSASARDFHLFLNVPIVTAVTDRLPLGGIGDGLHAAQESVHEVVGRLTGVRLPHDYLWLHLGRTRVPIDPINFSR